MRARSLGGDPPVPVGEMSQLITPPDGARSLPVYAPMRADLLVAYPAIDDETIAEIVADETHDPLFYNPVGTIQVTIAEPDVTSGGNDSVLTVFFATEDGPHVFHEEASQGVYSWTELFGLTAD